MSTLLRTTHFVVTLFQASGYVRVARTAAPFASVDDAADQLAPCKGALSKLDRSWLALLLDWRLAPLSTDARLHKYLVQSTDMLALAFVRCAVLVTTPVGKLQSVRVGKTHSSVVPEVFDDEAEAVAYLVER